MQRTAVAFAVFLLFLTATAHATTIVMPTDEQLITKSPVIVEGTVLGSHPVDRNGGIWTETKVQVTRTLRGATADVITVAEIGGELDDRITKVFGAPQFTEGEQVLLFLEPHGADYRTVDLFVGKFTRGATDGGRGLWIRSDADQPVTTLDGDFRPMKLPNVQRDAIAFDTYVEDRVHGREGVRNYFVENPAMQKSPRSRETGTFGGVTDNFTLISEPTVYRWFLFDGNQSANWYSFGSQPGYSGNGISEVQTGMSSWTSYSAAKIRYSYVGAGSGSPGGLSRPNGVNEVLLNDPLGEIPGTYNPSTGGIVGQGGYNAVRSGGSWTAPFAVDASHPAGTMRAYEIAEANLTIQDGVTPTARISSQTLAEIIAHEFGHTLGFGHTDVGGSLMYPSVTGYGPSLRADDQTAARWLYPSGTGGGGSTPQPTLPAAPSGLTASASGTDVTLQWIDNASNETLQSVYVASGTGAFSKAGDVGANVRSATLSGFSAGAFRFYVTAANGAGESQASNVASVTIASALTAAFTFSPSTPTTNDNVVFYDQSTGGVTSWQWSFGDGTTSFVQNPTKRFTQAGTYNVTLVVNRNGQTASTSRAVSIAAVAPAIPPVQAAFDVSTTSANSGAAIAFYDRSSGSPTSWQWTFGDGTTANAQNPSHVFAAAGTYNVTLTVWNAVSSSSASRQVTITQQLFPFRSLVSVTAQTAGVAGTTWRTELSIFNAGDAANVSLTFIPGAGGAVLTRNVYLGARQSLTYGNTLLELFGLSSGAGALAIEATSNSSTPQLKVSSRTYTGGATGTYGQSVPDVADDGLGTTLFLTGIQANDAFRTNVGLVNRGDAPLNAALTLLDASGGTVATANVTVAPRNFQQAALATYFPAIAGRSYDVLSMTATSSVSNAMSVYASVVDNRTQDPVYVQGIPARSGSSLTLPAVGRSAGANGTYWRSDVTIFNASWQRLGVSLRYLAAGADNNYAPVRGSITLEPRQTRTLADVLAQMGMEAGTGALELSWSGAAPVVTSRTYTTTASGGTYGQSIDPIASYGTAVDVPGLRTDGSYRSNIGFVNDGNSAVMVQVKLLAASGWEMASTWISLAPKSQQQWAATTLFPNIGSAPGGFTLSARSEGPIFAYGSMIDNASGDPVFFAGR